MAVDTEARDIQPSGRIIIAGGAGFLGSSLAAHLTKLGCDVVILSRQPREDDGPIRFAVWDGRSVDAWASHLDGAAAVVNLAGRTVDCVKTPDHRDEILRSRVEATRVLGQAARQIGNPPGVWVQMSTAHIYGDPPSAVCDEDSATGVGLAPFVGKSWEAACDAAVLPTMRVVVLRTSFVIGRGGGALTRLVTLARWGLGGTVGHGRQGMSWIHELDMNRLFTRAIADDTMKGIYIATSPNPVSNKAFMRELRRALRRPIGLPRWRGWCASVHRC